MSNESSVNEASVKSEENEEEEQGSGELKPQQSSEELSPSTYLIKPALQFKFRAQPVKQIIKTILAEQLQEKEYSNDDAKEWTKTIANIIRDKVRELNFRRYKIIVQVHLGEQKGAGMKSGIRCLWDSDCDNYTSEVYMSETIFCLAVVYAVYFY